MKKLLLTLILCLSAISHNSFSSEGALELARLAGLTTVGTLAFAGSALFGKNTVETGLISHGLYQQTGIDPDENMESGAYAASTLVMEGFTAALFFAGKFCFNAAFNDYTLNI